MYASTNWGRLDPLALRICLSLSTSLISVTPFVDLTPLLRFNSSAFPVVLNKVSLNVVVLNYPFVDQQLWCQQSK